MKTKAVRMYGKDDLRLEEFELPQIKEDEVLVKVMSDSICMSTYKLVEQGKKHKRAPQNIDTNPVIVGHECSGLIVEVGKKWQDQFKPGRNSPCSRPSTTKGSWTHRDILMNSAAAPAPTASCLMRSWNWDAFWIIQGRVFLRHHWGSR